uniref:PA14 domain-containing protein n=1 Tax=viral metagenome TaxID=1070528 RepID=A0A6C0DQR3_9ZZZZ
MDRLPKMVSKYLGAKPALKILIITILLAVGVFLVYRVASNSKEGFAPVDTWNAFTGPNKDYYWNKFNRGLVYTDGLQASIDKIDSATQIVDTQYNTINKPNLQKYFSVDPLPGLQVQNQQCAKVSEPSLLPPHDENTINGCGWWYVDDDAIPSTAARGSSSGPFDTTLPNRIPGGVWIWDLEEAQKREDIKRCRRMKTCDTADLFPGKCGYCTTLLGGVPIDGYGSSKYPDDPRYSCGTRVIVKPSMCPAPEVPPPVVNSDGTFTPSPVPRAICEPVSGQLSAACLISLATAVGLSNAGAILSILQGDANGYTSNSGNNAYNFTSANAIVKKDCNIVYEPAYVGNGTCTREAAMQYYFKIYNATRSGATKRCRDAAGFLAFGTDFDPCDYEQKQVGPFDLPCLVRTFREAGCQPDGASYPTEANKSQVDSLTWNAVAEFYRSLREKSNSSDYAVQADNAKQCLGVTITPKLSDCGDTRGCEVLWYAWENDYNFPINQNTKQTFLGRQISSTLPNFNVTDDSFNPYGRSTTTCFRIRTRIHSQDPTRTATIWVMTDDGIAINSQGKNILSQWRDQGPTAYTSNPFVLATGSPAPLDFYWYQDYGGATFVPKLSKSDGSYDFIPPSVLQMAVASGFPVCRWDFYMGTYNERNSVLTSKPNSLSFGKIGGRKCALFNDANSAIMITNPVRVGAFKSYTYMINVASIPAFWSRLFSFRRGTVNCDSGATFNGTDAVEGGVCNDGSVWLGVKPVNGGWSIWLQTPPGTITMNQWVHITYTFDADNRGATIFINGTRAASVQNDRVNGQFHDQLIATTTSIGIGHYKMGCNGQPIKCALAWVHWFDYPFTAENAQQDMSMMFTKSSVYPEDPNSGWVAKF